MTFDECSGVAAEASQWQADGEMRAKEVGSASRGHCLLRNNPVMQRNNFTYDSRLEHFFVFGRIFLKWK